MNLFVCWKRISSISPTVQDRFDCHPGKEQTNSADNRGNAQNRSHHFISPFFPTVNILLVRLNHKQNGCVFLMRTKNCRCIMDYILSLAPDRQLMYQRITDLSEHTGLSLDQTISACKELAEDRCVELKFLHLRTSQEILEAVRLTEFGQNYKAYLREQRVQYLLSKWIDFLALIVAVIALIVAIMK